MALSGDFPISSCDCQDCRAACNNSPGWFMPDQIAPLAKHLGLSVEDLFRKKLAVSVTRMPDGKEVHGVMPHKFRDGKKPGSVWTLLELTQPGRCVFFDHGKCTIYKFRPYECARMIHKKTKESVRLRRMIVPHWTGPALKDYAGFVGKKLMGASAKR